MLTAEKVRCSPSSPCAWLRVALLLPSSALRSAAWALPGRDGKAGPPTTHIATGPSDVWCWDVTFLPAQIQGRWFYFYLILDLYSRKIVGFEVHDTDSAEHAAHPGQANGAR